MSFKILFVIDGLGQSGSERSLAELLPYLSRANIQTVVACLHQREDGVQKEVQNGGHDVRFLKQSGWSGRIHELRKMIRTESPDIVHTTLFASNILGRIAASHCKSRVVSSLVNTPYDASRLRDPGISRKRLRMVQAIDGWTARNLTSHFHAVSESTKIAAVRDLRILPQKISVIERGRNKARLGKTDPERRMQARMKFGIRNGQQVLINVGRNEFQKGQSYLLEAMSRLHESHPNLVLLIAGRKGSVTQQLSDISMKNGLNGTVRLLGHRDDIPDLLAAGDIFVFPSLFEGLPGAVVEAMALELPIIAFDIPSLRDVVEPDRNSLLVPPASPEELANAIEVLLKDQNKCVAFGRRSREIFQERFTLERSSLRMIEFYKQIACL